MGKLAEVVADQSASGLTPTSIDGLYYRPVGFGDVRRMQDPAMQEGNAFLLWVMLDLLVDGDGQQACDSADELDQVPAQVVMRIVSEAAEYLRGNVVVPGSPAPPKVPSKRG